MNSLCPFLDPRFDGLSTCKGVAVDAVVTEDIKDRARELRCCGTRQKVEAISVLTIHAARSHPRLELAGFHGGCDHNGADICQ